MQPAIWMLAGALAFALMGVFTSALSTRCDWLVIALWRAVFMLGTAALTARSLRVPLALWEPRTLWIRSLAGSFSLVCNFYALTRLPVADALTLTNTYPLWIVLLSSLVLGILPTGPELVGILCGVAGVGLIEQPSLEGHAWAITVALLGAFSTSIALLGLNRLHGVEAPAILAHFAGVASVVAGMSLLTRGPEALAGRWDGVTIALLAGVAVSGTMGQFLLTKAYAAGRPTRLSAIGLMQVVFALGFDVLIWHRTLTPAAVVGFVLVLGPTAWLSIRAGTRLARVRMQERTVEGTAATTP